MSTLTGHAKITAQAVRELAAEWKNQPLATGLFAASLPEFVVKRDILDVLNQGHWADFGQKHHFMRQFDSQSPFEAYEAAVEWIRSNALKSAQRISARVAAKFPAGIDNSKDKNSVAMRIYFDGAWQPLGNAVHALEDSFAKGHATRGSGSPGPITHVKRYAGAEKEHHEEGDEEWKNESGGFSADGRLAIDAVKALLKVVIHTAQSGKSPESLVGWQLFLDKWLVADSSLSKSKDRVFELINAHYTGVRRGAWNAKTVNMNEAGLAKDLLGENMQTTLAVFERLDDQYNSDADDVAVLYVNLVKKAGGAKQAALASNKALVKRLIKVMDEGWTSDEEAKAITFLKGLK
ncbi:MAG: hypothetical protein R3C53_07945 [Pirellulaceae bacterium]